jgi:hypothetical protein
MDMNDKELQEVARKAKEQIDQDLKEALKRIAKEKK